jgi:hypothetical protein
MYMLIFLSDNAKLHIDYVTTKEVTAVEWTRCIRIGRKRKLRAFENACCIVHVKDNLLDRASLKAIASKTDSHHIAEILMKVAFHA